jgi:PAS domain S-box-containing protein
VLISYVDSDQRYRFVNNVYSEWFGGSPDDVLGRQPSEILGEAAYRAIKGYIDRALSGERVSFETAVPYESGGERYIDATYIPHRDSDGAVIGFFVIVTDITERKQAEDELIQFQTHLAHASRLNMVGEMAAGLAHEINQPLAVISSYAQGCLTNLHDDKTTPPDLDSALQQIVTQSARASEVVRRIRRFVSEANLPIASIDVNAAIGVAFDMLLSEARSREVTIRLDLAEPSPMAMIDEIELQQIVLNLARNGIEALSGNGSDHRELIIRTANVELSSNDGEAPVEVTVQDTGPGISSEIRNRVFDPFFTTKAGGLGLGLSICQSIVDRHGGRMWLDADDESGTAFHFTVPAD